MLEFQLLLATFAAWANRRQGSVITYLVEENRVLKEQLESGGRRLRFTDDQRRRLAAKGLARLGDDGRRAMGWSTSLEGGTFEEGYVRGAR